MAGERGSKIIPIEDDVRVKVRNRRPSVGKVLETNRGFNHGTPYESKLYKANFLQRNQNQSYRHHGYNGILFVH